MFKTQLLNMFYITQKKNNVQKPTFEHNKLKYKNYKHI